MGHLVKIIEHRHFGVETKWKAQFKACALLYNGTFVDTIPDSGTEKKARNGLGHFRPLGRTKSLKKWITKLLDFKFFKVNVTMKDSPYNYVRTNER